MTIYQSVMRRKGLADGYDVIVVGAGPAGATAARECSSRGLSTILIEKCRIPRPKPCGGGVSLKALKLIGRKIPDELCERLVKGFRFYSPSLESVEFDSESPVGISTKRDRFDAFLAKMAVDQGASFIDSDDVVNVIISSDGVTCRLRSGRNISGTILIGADGAKGTIDRMARIHDGWQKDQVGLCLETSAELDKESMNKIDTDLFELYFIDVPLGYAWLFPKRTSVSLGLGGSLEHLHHPREMLMEFCRTISKLKQVRFRTSEITAHLAPAGGFKRNIITDRIMLVGDAAGFIDPLTGEGIYYAMKSGLLAATASKKAIETNDYSRGFLQANYVRPCENAFGKDLRIALFLTYRIHNHFNTFFDLLKDYKGSAWAELAKGETSYRIMIGKLIPSLAVKFINKKVRDLFHIRRGG